MLGKAERLRIEELAGTPGDMMGCVADISRIRTTLGYAPQYSLEEGLANMFDWVKTRNFK